MVATLVAVTWQSVRGRLPSLYRVALPAFAFPPILLAMVWIVPSAAALGERTGTLAEQSAIARGVLWTHIYCFVSIALLAAAEFRLAWSGRAQMP